MPQHRIDVKEEIAIGGQLVASTACLETRLTTTIQDAGCGIPKDHLTHVFDPFFTPPFLERAGFTTKHGGTGLGLSVVHGIVEEHRGTIAIDSQPGQGTTVTLDFPLSGTA